MKLAATDPIENKALRPVLQGKTGSEFLNQFIPNIIGMSFIIGVLIFLFIMIIGAVQWITSGGDKTGLESARGKITNALIGIVLLLATFAIIKIIEDFMGIDILKIDLGPLYIE